MFCIVNNVQDFLNNSMKSWKLELNGSGEKLGEVDIRRGIFQGDSLSPLLLILCIVPLTRLLRRAKPGYKLGNKGFKLNHVLFMDNLKLFSKSKKIRGTDCAYIQWGHWYAIWTKTVRSAYHGERKSY